MPVPHRDAGRLCRFPGQRRQPAPADRQRPRLHRADRPAAQRQAARAFPHRGHRHGRQRHRDAGTLPARTFRDAGRRGEGQLAVAGGAPAYAEAGQAARRAARQRGRPGRAVRRRFLGAEALMAAAWTTALLALVMVLGAALLWRQAGRGARRQASSVFLERQLAQGQAGAAPAAGDPPDARRAAFSSGVARWDTLLRCAGIRQTAGLYAGAAGILALGVALAGLLGGIVSAGAAGVMLLVAMYFLIWLRADRRRARMFDQLPEMLDNMVRLITIGNSMAAAFQAAAANTSEPLREVVERAAHLSRSSQELDAALAQVARQYDFEELRLLAAVVRVAQRFGGRSDVVLERMAEFMRDVAQARCELAASSAEIRLSAWVLALLPLGIACYIMLTNNAMFMTMWDDPLGFKMLMAGLALQLLG